MAHNIATDNSHHSNNAHPHAGSPVAQLVSTIHTDAECPTCATLKDTIHTLDALSQDGFSKISTLASMALKQMETADGYPSLETVAQLLSIIQAKAVDIENLINCEAENVGCNYKDEDAERRYEAHRAAETRIQDRRHA